MQTLPPIKIAGRNGWLPLAPGTARLLVRCLVDSLSASDWESSLASDPGLVGWLLANPRLGPQLSDASTLSELAAKVAGTDVAAELVWPAADGEPQASLRDAWDATRLAEQSTQVAGDVSSSLKIARDFLRDDDGAAFAADDAERVVLQKIWAASGASVATGDGGQTGDSECAAGYWDGEATTIAVVLPRIALRLRRAGDIERDFDGQLEAAKIAAMKELAYGASHEINNPLANISTRAQTLLMDEVDPYRQKALAAIVRQAFRAHEMIADMMLFAHPPRLEYSNFELPTVVDEVLQELSADSQRQETKVVFLPQSSEPSLFITADRVQVGVAIKALVRNAIEALGEGGTVRVELDRPAMDSVAGDSSWQPGREEPFCQISVYDNGPGMSEEVRRHLFEPFYSGREAGRGLGFGMSKVWRIAELHGGSVTVHAAPGSETCIALQLPIKPGEGKHVASDRVDGASKPN